MHSPAEPAVRNARPHRKPCDEIDKLRRSVHGEVRRNCTKGWSCQLFFLCRLFLRELIDLLLHIFNWYVFDVGGDFPRVAERIFNVARAIAIELIGDRTNQGSASSYCLFGKGVNVRHVQIDLDGRSADS